MRTWPNGSRGPLTKSLNNNFTMAKPVIWTIDDDPAVLRAIERDLRRQYANRYRIMAADSGESALGTLAELKLRNDVVALFLVDQRMPGMSGVEFLEAALKIYPGAKRALLTAYADTDAAIQAINAVQVDYYFMKPWDPPEDRLYPVLDDLLDDWQQDYRPAFDGIRIVGHRWSPLSNEVRDFLARHFVPYQWLDLERSEEAQQLMAANAVDPACLPLVLLPDGKRLVKPGTQEIAQAIHLKVKPESPLYELVVVGAGPAGLAASVYGAADGLKTLLIERSAPGGQAGLSSRIENYLGFPAGLSGGDLARRAVAQARRFGAEILAPQHVVRVRVEGPSRVVTLADGSEVSARALLVATGIAYRKLDLPGLEKLNGAGVYYYPQMTEAMADRDADIYIVGGANSAGQAAVFFSGHARQVTMLVRGSSLSSGMSQYLEDRIKKTPNIAVRLNCSVVAVDGTERCEMITIRDSKAQKDDAVAASALFVYAGAIPYTDWLSGVVERDEQGYVIAGQHLNREGKKPRGWTLDRDPYFLESSVPGIFVAGDVRHRSSKGVTSGVGEGAMAVKLIHEYLAQV
jgi:thioredoxin reductase (NADPH)